MVSCSSPAAQWVAVLDDQDRYRFKDPGADRYLIKPVRPDTLRRVIDEMADDGRLARNGAIDPATALVTASKRCDSNQRLAVAFGLARR